MRTTLTLDDDVAVQIERLRRDRDASLKDIVNELLRRGLQAGDARPKKRKPFVTRAIDAGEPLLPNVDNVAEVLSLIEGEDFK
ncbi:MAG: CopG family transcriptional regulator [Vicinamibacterales bacterium]